MREKMTEERAAHAFFEEGFDCSQVVLTHICEELGLDKESALKVSSAFGGGIWTGEVCGCVTGAMMAIGLKYGHYIPRDDETKAQMCEKIKEFQERFANENGSIVCREILGKDFGDPKEFEEIISSGMLREICPALAKNACDILDDMM